MSKLHQRFVFDKSLKIQQSENIYLKKNDFKIVKFYKKNTTYTIYLKYLF